MSGKKNKGRAGKSEKVRCYYCNKKIKSSALKCPHCGKFFSTAKLLMAICVILLLTGAAYGINETANGNAGDEPIDESPDEQIFNPVHGIGTGSQQFWTLDIQHPSWVIETLQDRPIMILTHSEGCAPCVTQTDICESIYPRYADDLAYYDLLSGTDEPEASQTFEAYDPNGPPNYIPLTTVLTVGPDGTIIWHSWEGVVDANTLNIWIEDALDYHGKYA